MIIKKYQHLELTLSLYTPISPSEKPSNFRYSVGTFTVVIQMQSKTNKKHAGHDGIGLTQEAHFKDEFWDERDSSVLPLQNKKNSSLKRELLLF